MKDPIRGETGLWSTHSAPVGLLLAALIAASVTARAAAHDDPCVKAVSTDPGDSLRYQRRVDRCEGNYLGDVSLRLEVLSVTSGPRVLDVLAPALRMFWIEGAENVRLNVHATAPGIFYRMDAVPSQPGKFEWDLSILRQRVKLASLALQGNDLGFLAMGDVTAVAEQASITIPLKVGSAKGGDTIDLLVRASGKITRIFTTLKDHGANGTTTDVWKEREEVHRVAQGDAFTLTIPAKGATKGVYEYAITARGDGITNTTVWVLHE